MRRIGTVSIPTGDVLGNVWALTWVGRHLASPSRLFAANLYYPDSASLAYTESMLAQALVAGPLLAMGASPVAAYNVVWLLTFPLSGLGAYLLARRLSGSRTGAFLAGLAYAFCAYRLDSAVHLQTLSIHWLPFVILFLLRALDSPRLPNLGGCAAFTLLQALSSGYYAALLAPVIALTLAFHARVVSRRAFARVLAALGLAALIAVPAFLPYWHAQQRLGLARNRQELIGWSASWYSYLRPSGQALFPTLLPLRRLVQEGPALYPGTAILALAVVAVVARRRSMPFLLALAAVGALLSFGPEIRIGSIAFPGPYELVRSLPGYRLLRTPSRMAPAALLALVVMAAVGWAALAERSHAFRRWGLLLVLLTAGEDLMNVSPRFAPLPPAPPSARWLAEAPRRPVLELPWEPYTGRYAYWSIAHGQRMVNGFGAFAPPASNHLGIWGARWPGPGAARVLRGAGVGYVVVHVDQLPPRQRSRILETAHLPPGVLLAAEFGQDRVYTISPDGPKDPMPGEIAPSDPS